MARPTKLTRETHDRIVLAVRAGNYLIAAAAAAGVSEATLHRWLTDSRPLYRALRDDVARAAAEAEVQTVALILRSAALSPAQGWKWLERRHRDRWGLAGAQAVPPPPEEPPAQVEPEAPAPFGPDVVLGPKWSHIIIKIFVAAQAGWTPEKLFAGSHRLDNLRESSEPFPEWWQYTPGDLPDQRLPNLVVSSPSAPNLNVD
jgi:hypothetical protein